VEQIEEAALVVPGSVEHQMVEAVLDVFASLFDGLVGSAASRKALAYLTVSMLTAALVASYPTSRSTPSRRDTLPPT
jgi:hypothetical protein